MWSPISALNVSVCSKCHQLFSKYNKHYQKKVGHRTGNLLKLGSKWFHHRPSDIYYELIGTYYNSIVPRYLGTDVWWSMHLGNLNSTAAVIKKGQTNCQPAMLCTKYYRKYKSWNEVIRRLISSWSCWAPRLGGCTHVIFWSCWGTSGAMPV